MKQYIVGSLLLATAAGSFAAGPYDGIYSEASGTKSYVSVHTNGDQAIVTSYEIIPASGVYFATQFGTVYPRQVNTWQLLQGTISGSTASLSGQLMYNQCNVRLSATFSATALKATITSSSSSNAGYSSTLNCSALVGYQLNFNKLF